ncbi:MAG: uL15 family ribosomal protein [Candidatus Nealsonbacteria bacterium]|nr:uL15 family ribosomal protein [Candidatus Nealsonbacteria bacterium]
MQLHQLKPIHKRKKRKRLGRGGKRGTYSGRGMKGQKSRAGARFEPIIRGLIKRYPKLRGYRNRSVCRKAKSKSEKQKI